MDDLRADGLYTAVFPLDLPGSAQEQEPDSLVHGLLGLLRVGGHLRLAAAVEHRYLRSQPPGRARRVQRHVAPANDRHLGGQLHLLPQVYPAQEFQRPHYTRQVLPGIPTGAERWAPMAI